MRRLGVGVADQEKLAQRVREITEGAQLPAAEFTRRVETWLGKRHGYSLSPKIPDGNGDALVRWLESNEGGHCELFAGSYVLLARAAGYSARVVTGFRGGSWNGYSGNFTLRNADAHAWCEIFDPVSGAWLRADPTLGAASAQAEGPAGEASLAKRTDRSWSARFDSLRVFWYRRIVNFDQRSQVETLKAVKSATENTGRQLRDFLASLSRQVGAWFQGPWDVRRWVNVLAGFVIVGALIWGWLRVGRRWWQRMGRGSAGLRLDPIRQEAGHWLRRFTDAQGGGPEFERVTSELQRLRYGAQKTWPEPKAVFRGARQAWKLGRAERGVTVRKKK
jgi:transglutaminase-like putative cysteine protease